MLNTAQARLCRYRLSLFSAIPEVKKAGHRAAFTPFHSSTLSSPFLICERCLMSSKPQQKHEAQTHQANALSAHAIPASEANCIVRCGHDQLGQRQ